MTLFKYIGCFALVWLTTRQANAQLTPWWEQDIIDSAAVKEEALADSIVEYAKSFLGTPYVWGGSEPKSGFDCSGFICYVYKAFEIELPRTSGQQFDAGNPIPHVEAKPGDIIVFSGPKDEPGDPGHVGIVLDYDDTNGFTFIHTSSPESGGVRISSESSESYYKQHFLEVRRVIQID